MAVVALAVMVVLFLTLPEDLAWVTAIAAGASGGALGTYLIGATKEPDDPGAQRLPHREPPRQAD